MEQEQRRMAQRFDGLTKSLKDVDYNIGMTTTDLVTPKYRQDGRLMKWEGTNSISLTPRTPKAENVFKDTITRKETVGCNLNKNECPSGYEQPLKATVLAMEQQFTANAGFFRQGADLAVIVLSNEDELSDGTTTRLPDGKLTVPTKAPQVLAAFDAAFHQTKKLAVYGIIIKPGDKDCLKEMKKQSNVAHNAYYGNIIDDLVKQTGGSSYSICDENYTQSLSAISSQVRKLISTFELANEPQAGSVKVVLSPAQPVSFHVEGKKVVFDIPPVAGSRIEISYLPK
jgi:hypothetical protein